jgi:hypothetical protein
MGRLNAMRNFVMPGLVPGIHVFAGPDQSKTWMAGTSPAMTNIVYAGLICLARKRNLAFLPATKQHDGQIGKNLSSPSRKNIPLHARGKSVI